MLESTREGTGTPRPAARIHAAGPNRNRPSPKGLRAGVLSPRQSRHVRPPQETPESSILPSSSSASKRERRPGATRFLGTCVWRVVAKFARIRGCEAIRLNSSDFGHAEKSGRTPVSSAEQRTWWRGHCGGECHRGACTRRFPSWRWCERSHALPSSGMLGARTPMHAATPSCGWFTLKQEPPCWPAELPARNAAPARLGGAGIGHRIA